MLNVSAESPVSGGFVLMTMLPLFAATASCVLAYPELAIHVDQFIGGRGGSGSSLGYFRDFYVLPGALTFLLVSAAALAFSARRGRRAVLAGGAIAWIVLLIALVGSVEWYYRAVRAASELR